MERRLAAAGVPVLIVRAGDFFGPGAGNNWFAQGLVKPGRPLASVTLPGDPGIGHQWAYVPDVAETVRIPRSRSHWPVTGRGRLETQFAAALIR